MEAKERCARNKGATGKAIGNGRWRTAQPTCSQPNVAERSDPTSAGPKRHLRRLPERLAIASRKQHPLFRSARIAKKLRATTDDGQSVARQQTWRCVPSQLRKCAFRSQQSRSADDRARRRIWVWFRQCNAIGWHCSHIMHRCEALMSDAGTSRQICGRPYARRGYRAAHGQPCSSASDPRLPRRSASR